jgi:hypothetical protein
MRKIINTSAAAIKIPFPVKAELLHSAAKSNKPVEGRRAVLEFTRPCQLIPPSDARTVSKTQAGFFIISVRFKNRVTGASMTLRLRHLTCSGEISIFLFRLT